MRLVALSSKARNTGATVAIGDSVGGGACDATDLKNGICQWCSTRVEQHCLQVLVQKGMTLAYRDCEWNGASMRGRGMVAKPRSSLAPQGQTNVRTNLDIW